MKGRAFSTVSSDVFEMLCERKEGIVLRSPLTVVKGKKTESLTNLPREIEAESSLK